MSDRGPSGYREPHGANVQIYGAIIFHSLVPFRDAPRAGLPGNYTKFRSTIRSSAGYVKTRGIIGTYGYEYKPDTCHRHDWMGVPARQFSPCSLHRHNNRAIAAQSRLQEESPRPNHYALAYLSPTPQLR